MTAERTAEAAPPPVGHDDIRRLCGDILDWKLNAIQASGAGLAEIEEAVAYFSGQDDVMGEERKPLVGAVAAVYDILAADEEFEDDRG
jgi:hypothetical protein